MTHDITPVATTPLTVDKASGRRTDTMTSATTTATTSTTTATTTTTTTTATAITTTTPPSAVDSRLLGITRFQLYCSVSAVLGTINYGWNNGVLNVPGDIISQCLLGPRISSDPFPSCIPTESTVWGIGIGAFPLGGACSAIISGFLANRYGRRPLLMWSNLFTVAGSLVLATSTTFAQIIVGRFIMGLQTGMASSTISAYIGEITTPKARTTLGSLLQSSVTIGIFLALTISLGLSKPPLWRILLGLSGIVGLASMLMFRNAVESPRWLVNNGREDEARQSLQSLRRGADIDAELEDYRNLAKSSAAVFAPSPSTNRSKPGFISPRGATIMDILLNRTPHNLRHQLFVVTCLMIFQQFSGINAIVFYSTSIFRSITNESPEKPPPSNAQIFAWTVSLAPVVSTLVTIYLISHLGRRSLLLFSHCAMAIAMLCISLGSIYNIKPLTIVMLIFYNTVFVMGAGPLPWTAAAEMTPSYAMSALTSLGTAVNLGCSFGIGVFFHPLYKRLGNYTFLFYMGFNVLAFAFICLFIPETRNRRVEDIIAAHSTGIHFAFLVPDVPTINGIRQVRNQRAGQDNLPITPAPVPCNIV